MDENSPCLLNPGLTSFCVMYDIGLQQTAFIETLINICKDTLQMHCDIFGFLRTEVAKSVRSIR